MVNEYAFTNTALLYCMTGIREAEINIAEGKKQARILNSEAFKAEQINQAHGK